MNRDFEWISKHGSGDHHDTYKFHRTIKSAIRYGCFPQDLSSRQAEVNRARAAGRGDYHLREKGRWESPRSASRYLTSKWPAGASPPLVETGRRQAVREPNEPETTSDETYESNDIRVVAWREAHCAASFACTLARLHAAQATQRYLCEPTTIPISPPCVSACAPPCVSACASVDTRGDQSTLRDGRVSALITL